MAVGVLKLVYPAASCPPMGDSGSTGAFPRIQREMHARRCRHACIRWRCDDCAGATHLHDLCLALVASALTSQEMLDRTGIADGDM